MEGFGPTIGRSQKNMKNLKLLTSIVSSITLVGALGISGAQAADDRIAKIEASGELRVCHAEDNPWTYRDPLTGKWLGFTRDLAADLAEELGVELVDVDSTWKTIVPSVKNDECDIGGGGLFATVTRAKVVLFTIPFAYAHSTAIVHKESSYSIVEEVGFSKNRNTVYSSIIWTRVTRR